MLGSKLNYVSKRGPECILFLPIPYNMYTYVMMKLYSDYALFSYVYLTPNSIATIHVHEKLASKKRLFHRKLTKCIKMIQ